MRHCYIIELVYKVFSFRTSTRMSGRRHLSSTQDLQTVGDEFDAISWAGSKSAWPITQCSQ